MKRAVIKVGGSVLRQPSDICRIVDMVRRYPRPPVVIVSAFAGITEYLIKMCDNSTLARLSDTDMLEFLTSRAMEYLTWPVGQFAVPENAIERLERRLKALSLLYRWQLRDVTNDIRRQMILSYGERISSLVISMHLQYAGIPSFEALPEEIGLVVSEDDCGAHIDITASRTRVRRSLERDGVVVVPGFYGVTRSGTVRLLGRNGSDYSAAGIAACLDAESLDLYKDVDGICNCDPSIISNAGTIPLLSYAEARDIAHFGSHILHPLTIEPVMEREIPIHIYGPKGSVATGPHTIVSIREDRRSRGVKAIVTLSDVRVIYWEGNSLFGCAELLQKLSGQSIMKSAKALYLTPTNLQILVAAEDSPRTINALRSSMPAGTVVQESEPRSLVALVGQGTNAASLLHGQATTALWREGLDSKVLSAGSSPAAIFITLRPEGLKNCIKALHSAFFESRIPVFAL